MAAGTTHQGVVTQGSHGAQVAPMDGSATAGELDYFHAYKASRTYAIQFKDGLRATLDFNAGTITLDDGVNQTTIPLDDALLQANNGNADAAAQMFDQMYQDISASQSDAIMTYEDAGSYGAYVNPPRRAGGIGDLGDPLWSTPGPGGVCWPIPNPCHEWGGGLTNLGLGLGTYNHWWGGAFGDPPPTPNPPNPGRCAPNDTSCIIWETKRDDACDDQLTDALTASAVGATAWGACRVSARGGWVTGAIGCGAGALSYGLALYRQHKDMKTCRTPYPGP